MKPSFEKYIPFKQIDIPDRTWPSKTITKAPIWCSVACGIQILFTKPFEVGDYIQVEDKEGTVTNIEIMFVTLTTLSNQIVILPNYMYISWPGFTSI